jgi:hypothetical protein
MGKLRRRVAWWVRGDRYAAALEQQTGAVGELQRQVAALSDAVGRLERDGAARDDLRALADDLTARLAAITERLDHT